MPAREGRARGGVESWRPVKGWPGYSVSDTGRVCGPRGLLRGDKGNRGHQRVTLCRRGARRVVGVAILVLEAFDGPRPRGLFALHDDDDKANNRLSNLRWGTRADNAKDARRNGRTPVGARVGTSKLRPCCVRDLRARAAAGESAAALARELGISRAAASAAIRGDTWGHVGEAG